MGYKEKDEPEGKKHNPARVAACLEEYHHWHNREENYANAVKFYNRNTEVLQKYYKTFYDYYMEHNKTCTEKIYFEIWKDKFGNRQTIMYPTLDDNDNIVYRVRDPHHDISDTIRIGQEEPDKQEETDEKMDDCVKGMADKFNPRRK
jgi:hypothetical protein